MHTERVTFLATAKDKALLARRASEEGISVGEYVRRRALNDEDDGLTVQQEEELKVLTAEVNRLVPEMLTMLDDMTRKLRTTNENVDRKLREMGAR